MKFLIPLSLLLAGCTVYERLFGTSDAHIYIYDALWFQLLWGIVLVYVAYRCVRAKMWRRPLLALHHVAFLLMVIGYGFTTFSATTGRLHLRQGIAVTRFFTSVDRVASLPCPLTLERIEAVDASQVYCKVKCGEAVKNLGANAVLTFDDYRLYSSNVDADGRGVGVLLIQDSYGRFFSHSGFYLFIVIAVLRFVIAACRRVVKWWRASKLSNAESSEPQFTARHSRLLLILNLHVVGFALYDFIGHWARQGFIPFITLTDTFLLLSLLLALLGLWLLRVYRHFLTLMSLALLGLGVFLAAHFSRGEASMSMPQILNSSWLALHLIPLLVAYSLLTLCALLAVVSLYATDEARSQRLTHVSRMMLTPAVTLLTLGVIIGAIWAGESWGNYWSWDPKETWALITLLLYLVPMHKSSNVFLSTPKRYHRFMLLAFSALLMTYVGVTFFLGGMHSY